MAILKTPSDLGNVIRQRRKALGWDQARLAYETGVSRQWIIEIEKGKARAELQLVLRVFNVLGIELNASPRQVHPVVASNEPKLVLPDIDRIIAESRGQPGRLSNSMPEALPKLPPALLAVAEQFRHYGKHVANALSTPSAGGATGNTESKPPRAKSRKAGKKEDR